MLKLARKLYLRYSSLVVSIAALAAAVSVLAERWGYFTAGVSALFTDILVVITVLCIYPILLKTNNYLSNNEMSHEFISANAKDMILGKQYTLYNKITRRIFAASVCAVIVGASSSAYYVYNLVFGNYYTIDESIRRERLDQVQLHLDAGRIREAEELIISVMDDSPRDYRNRHLETITNQIHGMNQVAGIYAEKRDLPANTSNSVRKFDAIMARCSMINDYPFCYTESQKYINAVRNVLELVERDRLSCFDAMENVSAEDRYVFLDRADEIWIGAANAPMASSAVCEALGLQGTAELQRYLRVRWRLDDIEEIEASGGDKPLFSER